MKICAAQARSHKGDIQDNIENHKKFIELAIFYKANTIIFSELSLTGYEPELAKKLALNINDSRLDVFQKISDDHHIIIGVGSSNDGRTASLHKYDYFSSSKTKNNIL